MTKTCLILLVAFVSGLCAYCVAAQSSAGTDPVAVTSPEETQPAPDLADDSGSSIDPARIDALAKQYGTTAERVTAMRQQTMGYGEIENALALAARITADGAAQTPPVTMDQALDGILAERAAGAGWGKIANDHGVRLGEVVSGAHGEGRAEKPEKVEKPERVEKPEKPERPSSLGKPEKTGKPDKPEKPDKPSHGHGSD